MITDLGIHLYRGNLEGLEGLEPDDLEARKRLYLSAYFWDKYGRLHFLETFVTDCGYRSISLCLGRQPSLPDLPYAPDSLCKFPLALSFPTLTIDKLTHLIMTTSGSLFLFEE